MNARARAGFTLIETVVAMAILMIFLAGLAMVLYKAQVNTSTSSAIAGSQALTRYLSAQLRSGQGQQVADVQAILPPLGSSAVTDRSAAVRSCAEVQTNAPAAARNGLAIGPLAAAFPGSPTGASYDNPELYRAVVSAQYTAPAAPYQVEYTLTVFYKTPASATGESCYQVTVFGPGADTTS